MSADLLRESKRAYNELASIGRYCTLTKQGREAVGERCKALHAAIINHEALMAVPPTEEVTDETQVS